MEIETTVYIYMLSFALIVGVVCVLVWKCCIRSKPSVDVEGEQTALLSKMDKLGRMVQDLPDPAKDRDYSPTTDCPVCLDRRAIVSLLPCRHGICRGCILILLQQQIKQQNPNLVCPVCKQLVCDINIDNQKLI
eukprot:TRINITY_DN12472_c0_g1_i1.p1 TRINITY_DN12472_c0_g1~~TRINITY_DN12472_c0_g1_i1.p1  ORF type:complete len:134 (-),score=18.18 TRINITY_DN12472_c0_g1_i1:169-570(-)